MKKNGTFDDFAYHGLGSDWEDSDFERWKRVRYTT